MRLAVAFLAALTLCVALFAPPTVTANDGLLQAALTTYPGIAGSALDSCDLCHSSVPNFNPYGMDFATAGNNFAAVEGMDSDGDGFDNITEINALTFPGDASSFPSGGGGGRVLGRETLESISDTWDLAVATDVDRDEALITWIEGTAARTGGRFVAAEHTVGEVYSVLVDSDGASRSKTLRVDKGDVNAEGGLAVAYGTKGFLTSWSDVNDDTIARPVKAKKGKPIKKPVVVNQGAVDPAVTWDADMSRYLVASGSDAGVLLGQVDKKGKVTRSVTIPEVQAALGFVVGGPASGRILLGGEVSGAGTSPLGVLLESGAASSFSATYGKANKIMQAVAASDGVTSAVTAWLAGTSISTGALDDDGSLDGKASSLRGVKGAAVGIAAQSDGNYLVVWTEANGSLMAIDRNAAGKDVGDAFELHAAGESVVPQLLGVAPLGDAVIVVYATTDAIRSAIVGPAS